MTVEEVDYPDSEDLTAEELSSAHIATNTDEMAAVIKPWRCVECGACWTAIAYQHRRKAPFTYTRVKFRCEAGHEETRLVRMDWLSI